MRRTCSSVSSRIFALIALTCSPLLAPQALAQQPPAGQNPGSSALKADPTLLHRPLPRPVSPLIREGKLFLDATVTGATGKPVTGLQPWDFKLLDNDRPAKILSFRSYDGATVLPDPPVEVVLLVDELNLPPTQVAFVRSQLAGFLVQNGGRLSQPVSIILLTEKGIRVQPRPSTNGNALLAVLTQIKAHISSINAAMGSEGALERAQISLRQLASIAENKVKVPGRKLLIWIGPGWPLLDSQSLQLNERDRRNNFRLIVELTNRLREARITLDSVAPQDAAYGGLHPLLYQSFLKSVRSERQADLGNLALKVLVTNTGGKVLGPDNDLIGQLDQCIAGVNAFYRVSFDPPPAEHPDELHDLTLQVDQPGVVVHTATAYYNQPPGS